MEYQDQVRIITDIEKNVPVHLISYEGTKIWPVVRLAIWQHIFDGPKSLESSRKKKSFLKRLRRFSDRLFSAKNTYQKTDAVFLVASNERRVFMNGAYYSPFSNSVRELLQQINIPSAMLDLDQRKLPIYGDTYFIGQETVDFWKRRFVRKVVTHWDELLAYMQKRCPEHIPEQSRIIAYCEQVLRYENIFTRILKKMEPKIAFLVCYYHPAAMGYIKACRKLGIKTVEIQHGDLYGMYRDWTNIPSEGYELLPSAFWCWGKESADKIRAWSDPVRPEHEAFVGGNPWISRCLHASPSSKNERVSDNTVRVLVALTSVPYSVDNIISAIKKSPDTIRWIVRPHPAMPELTKIFMSAGTNVTIENSPTVSLFDLLRQVDFLITPCSTVAYEAFEFRVHPIITHADGLEKFNPNITKGLFSYADTGDSILKILLTDRSSFNFHEESPYMETRPEIIERALKNLFSQ